MLIYIPCYKLGMYKLNYSRPVAYNFSEFFSSLKLDIYTVQCTMYNVNVNVSVISPMLVFRVANTLSNPMFLFFTLYRIYLV